MFLAVVAIVLFFIAFSSAMYTIICATELYKNTTRKDWHLNLLPFLMLFKSTYELKAYKYYYRFWLALSITVASFLAYSFIVYGSVIPPYEN